MPAARVLIDGPSELVFDYAIPDGLPVQPGCRVRVPLRQKNATGTVLAVSEPEDLGFALRPLHSLTDPEPLITPKLLELAHWIANYYGCSIESVIRVLLPEAVRTEENAAKTRKVVFLHQPPPEDELAQLAKRAPKQHTILSLLQHAPDNKLPLTDLGAAASASVKSLVSKGLVQLLDQEVRRDPDADGVDELLPTTDLPLSEEQQASLDAILQSLEPRAESTEPEPGAPISKSASTAPEGPPIVKSASTAPAEGRTSPLSTFYSPLATPPQAAPSPLLTSHSALGTPPQAARPFLLHGVTGSGKTEVYLQAARHTLEAGKTVLVLVPEISLTPQTVRRFRARFADIQDQVAVLHSNLSQGERFDEWHRIRKGKARIVIGARPAPPRPRRCPG